MAQEFQATDSKISWKDGTNVSNWTEDGSDGVESKVGFKLGACIEYALDKDAKLFFD